MGKQRTALILLLILCLGISSLLLVRATEGSWTLLEPMPIARSGFGVAVVDGKIYAIGGWNGCFLSTNEMYDSETDTWTTKVTLASFQTDELSTIYQMFLQLVQTYLFSDPMYSFT